jgi:hypothetical protein
MNARIICLILVLLSLFYGIWHYHSDAGRLKLEVDQLRTQASALQKQHQADLATALKAEKQEYERRIESLEKQHQTDLTAARQGMRQQMARALREFDNIFSENQKTLSYLNDLDAKLKSGQELQQAELEKLSAISHGLAFLQKQYQKPVQEFTALQDYFDEVAKRPNEKPRSNFGFFKRVFNKNFREAEKEYEREEGARRAFSEAQTQFTAVYAKAQRSLKQVNLDSAKLISRVDELLQKKQPQEDLRDLLNQARKTLRTHQEVLDFEPEGLTPPATGPGIAP